MKTYKVRIKNLHIYEFDVEAENEEEARGIAIEEEERHSPSDIIFHDFEATEVKSDE